MLERLTATQVIREAAAGRTKPLIVSCNKEDAQPIELFCKVSEGCEEGVVGLAMEVVAACIAVRLQLPVPNPFLVDLPPRLSDVSQDERIRRRIVTSSSVAFGSMYLPRRFVAWHKGSRVNDETIHVALGAFVFDAVIDNADRRPSNPNCLHSGQEIRLIDHELAFPRNLVGNQPPPWKEGGLRWLHGQDQHIFWKELRRHRHELDFSGIPGLWETLSDECLERIRRAVPAEWGEACPAVDKALDRIRQARANMSGVISEVRRVLK